MEVEAGILPGRTHGMGRGRILGNIHGVILGIGPGLTRGNQLGATRGSRGHGRTRGRQHGIRGRQPIPGRNMRRRTLGRNLIQAVISTIRIATAATIPLTHPSMVE